MISFESIVSSRNSETSRIWLQFEGKKICAWEYCSFLMFCFSTLVNAQIHDFRLSLEQKWEVLLIFFVKTPENFYYKIAISDFEKLMFLTV